jgi:hypothetical protein
MRITRDFLIAKARRLSGNRKLSKKCHSRSSKIASEIDRRSGSRQTLSGSVTADALIILSLLLIFSRSMTASAGIEGVFWKLEV